MELAKSHFFPHRCTKIVFVTRTNCLILHISQVSQLEIQLAQAKERIYQKYSFRLEMDNSHHLVRLAMFEASLGKR